MSSFKKALVWSLDDTLLSFKEPFPLWQRPARFGTPGFQTSSSSSRVFGFQHVSTCFNMFQPIQEQHFVNWDPTPFCLLILCQRVMIFYQISFRILHESNEHPHLPGISGPWKPPPESRILRGCYPRLSPLQPFKKWEAVPTDVLAGENGWLLTPAIRELWTNHIRITVSMSLIQFNHI